MLQGGSSKKLGAVFAATCALLYAMPNGVISTALCHIPLLFLSGKLLVKPKTATEHAANILIALIWSVHSIFAIKLLSLGALPMKFGSLLPFLSLSFLVSRSKDPATSHTHSRLSRKVVELLFDPPLVAHPAKELYTSEFELAPRTPLFEGEPSFTS